MTPRGVPVTSPDGSAPDLPRADVTIAVAGLTKRFGDLVAVDGVSFEVGRGELFGLLGPNGAGKSTTISMLCALQPPTAGSARVAGHDVATHSMRVRREIGVVFQASTSERILTAREHLRFHGVLYGMPAAHARARTAMLLELVGLADRADDPVEHFSGGMRRRLEIARGLLHEPSVLFLDEPTIGLDPQTRRMIWEYIDRVRAESRTTIFATTHYMDEAEGWDRIAIIDHGRVVALDTPGALMREIGGDTVSLVTEDNEQALADLGKLGLEGVVDGEQLRVTVSDGQRELPRLIAATGVTVLHAGVHRPTLDDVFVRLTGKAIREDRAPKFMGGLR